MSCWNVLQLLPILVTTTTTTVLLSVSEPTQTLQATMSSYQFVNTLAQCYAAEQSGQTGSANAQASQDYYNMNYPNCYSPNLAAHAQQYGQYSLMMTGSGGGGGAAGSGGGQNPGGGGAADNGFSVATSSQQQQQQQPQQPPQQQPTATGQRGSANQSPITSSSCNRVGGSPQDLSRASDGETPNLCQSTTSLGALQQPKTPDTPSSPMGTTASPSSGSKDATSTDRSSTGGAGAGGGGASSCNNNSSGSKNNKHTGGGASSDADSEGKSSTNNPPQIYPWMKRVHLGQSKFRLL